MGTYYSIENKTKNEEICLSAYTSIKYGSMGFWSLQMTVLGVFLGKDWYRSGIDLSEYTGIWRGDKLEITNDGEYDWSNIDEDMGEEFLLWLHTNGNLEKWLLDVGCPVDRIRYIVESATRELARYKSRVVDVKNIEEGVKMIEGGKE